MLAQHLITKPVFDALFAGHDFAAHNPVSQDMQTMVDTLGDAGLEAETAKLEGFYDSVRMRASEVSSAEGKQQIIAELYEKFFRIGFKKQSDALGIVYTPVEIVDFILRAADHVLRDAFRQGLNGARACTSSTRSPAPAPSSPGCCSPASSRPLTWRASTANELHANEIMLLAYYIAAVNIEATYHALVGKTADTDDYEPFPGSSSPTRSRSAKSGDSMDAIMFPQNNDRIVKQLADADQRHRRQPALLGRAERAPTT